MDPVPLMKCFECALPATWVRRTQFSGNHYFCDHHSIVEKFRHGEGNETFVWKRYTEEALVVKDEKVEAETPRVAEDPAEKKRRHRARELAHYDGLIQNAMERAALLAIAPSIEMSLEEFVKLAEQVYKNLLDAQVEMTDEYTEDLREVQAKPAKP